MIKIAILMDGGFVLKRLYKVCPDLAREDAKAAADKIYTLALSHLNQSTKRHKVETYLYRLFFMIARHTKRNNITQYLKEL